MLFLDRRLGGQGEVKISVVKSHRWLKRMNSVSMTNKQNAISKELFLLHRRAKREKKQLLIAKNGMNLSLTPRRKRHRTHFFEPISERSQEMEFRGFGTSLSQHLGCPNHKPQTMAAASHTTQTASQAAKAPVIFHSEVGRGEGQGERRGQCCKSSSASQNIETESMQPSITKLQSVLTQLPHRCLRFRPTSSTASKRKPKPGFQHIVYYRSHKKTSFTKQEPG